MASAAVARRRWSRRRRLAGTGWLWRVRGRRKSRSSSWLRQKRSAETKLLNPRIHRVRPLIPRWSCSSLLLWDGPPLSPAALGWQGNLRDGSWSDADRGSRDRPGQEQLPCGGSGRERTGGLAATPAPRRGRRAGGRAAELRDGDGGLWWGAPS